MQGLIPKFSRNSTNPINVLVMKNKCFSAPLKNCTKTVHHQIVNKHLPHAVSYGQNWAFVLPRPSLSADLHIFSLFFWKSCHIIRLWPIALGFLLGQRVLILAQEKRIPADLASGRNLGKGPVEAASVIWRTIYPLTMSYKQNGEHICIADQKRLWVEQKEFGLRLVQKEKRHP